MEYFRILKCSSFWIRPQNHKQKKKKKQQRAFEQQRKCSLECSNVVERDISQHSRKICSSYVCPNRVSNQIDKEFKQLYSNTHTHTPNIPFEKRGSRDWPCGRVDRVATHDTGIAHRHWVMSQLTLLLVQIPAYGLGKTGETPQALAAWHAHGRPGGSHLQEQTSRYKTSLALARSLARSCSLSSTPITVSKK